MLNKYPALFSIAILLSLGLSGCSNDLIKTEQPSKTGVKTQKIDQNIGQTFTAHYDGLQAIQLEIDPITNSEGVILLHLRHIPMDAEDIRTVQVDAREFDSTGAFSFRFPAIQDSTGSDYYLVLETQGQSQINIQTGPAESYIYGSLYTNDEPQEAQLSFSLGYDPLILVLGVLQELWIWAGWVFLSLLLFVFPGWAILGAFWPNWQNLLWAEKAGLAVGLSVGIYPVIVLWTHLAGLQLGRFYVWLPTIIGLVIVLNRARKSVSTEKPIFSAFSFVHPSISAYDLGVWMILVSILGTRLWVLRNLDMPLWGDGYQHTMISQLLVDNQGLFNSWLPYAELSTFTYHFGFHSLSAVFHWISSLNIPESTLLIGQIANFLAVLGLYPLCMRLTNNRWAALISVLLVGLFFSMPMYYINWGRYSQLSGLVILPVLVYMLWLTLDSPKFDKRTIFLNGFVFCGLALTHYRVWIIALLFIPAWFIFNFRSEGLRLAVKKVFWIGVTGALLALPWLAQVFSGKLDAIVGGQLAAPAGDLSDLTLIIDSLPSYLPFLAWLSLPVIILLGVLRREKDLALVWVWWLLVFLAANPQIFGLPGSGIITNFAVFISAFIPASITIGCASGWLVEWLNFRLSESIQALHQPSRSVLFGLVFILLLGLCLYGAKTRLSDVKISEHILTTRPDLRAAGWIQESLPASARLLVNSFFAYNGTAVVGSDGGWWLPIIAGRLTSLPPLNYVSEQGYEPDFYQSTNDLTALIEAKGLNDPEVLDELNRRGLTHVYIGQLQGSVNSGGVRMNLEELQNSPHYLPVYQQDRVWIFEIIR